MTMGDPVDPLATLQQENAALRQRIAQLEQAQAQAGETNLRAEQHYRALFENAPVMYVITSDRPDGPIIVDCNALFARTLGYSPSQMLERPLADFYTPDSREHLLNGGYARSLREPLRAEDRQLFTRSHQIVTTLLSTRPRLDDTGRTIGTHAIYIDVTARHSAEAALRQAQQQSEMFFAQSLDGFFFMLLDEPVRWDDRVDKDQTLDYVFAHQRVVKINQAMLDQYRATSNPFLGQTPADFFAHDLAQGRRVWRQFFDAGQLHIGTDERRFDGTPMSVEGDYVCMYDAAGRITGHFGIQRDVTERTQMEHALRQSEERWSFALEGAGDGVWDLDVTTNRVFYSPQWKAMLGYAADEISPDLSEWSSRVHPDDLPLAQVEVQRHLDGLTPIYQSEHRLRAKDGTYRWILGRGKVVSRTPAGQALRVIATHTDITARKQTEAALARRIHELASLYETSLAINLQTDLTALLHVILERQAELTGTHGGSIYLLEADGQSLRKASSIPVSPSTDQALWLGEGVAGRVVHSGEPFMVPDYAAWAERPAIYTHTLARRVLGVPLRAGTRVIGAMTVVDREHTGPFTTEMVQLISLFAAQAAVAIENTRLLAAVQHYAGTLEQRVADRTTELQSANARLTELDRLKDEFLSRISHELRTPLANIKIYLGLLDTARPEKRDQYLLTLTHEADRLHSLIEDVLLFSQLNRYAESPEIDRIKVNHWLEGRLTAWQNKSAERQLGFKFNLSPDLPRAIADAELALQVLTRLLANAVNYTPTGSVTVSTALRDESGRRWVTVSVTDTGPGITADDLPHIFERFYRGRAAANYKTPGTGIGLTISREIANRLGGRLTVDTQVGVGSTFTLWLPAA